MEGLPESFAQATRSWLEGRFEAPTPVQRRGWPLLASGGHALLIAPTGGGKTLAAFLEAIDRLGSRADPGEPGVRVLYVSPLKALVYDIERNLRAPLAGIAACAAESGDAAAFRAPRVAVRTGDTSARERRLQARDPAEILVTTPESLYLILGSRQRETLRHVETVIVDEIHALAPTKRGVHLALSLERLARLCGPRDRQRIGLSATARPPETIARYLGGDRRVEVVDTSAPPAIDCTISVPVADMTRPTSSGRDEAGEASGGEPKIEALADEGSGSPETIPITEPDEIATDSRPSLWDAIHPVLLELVRAHRSSIVFVNSRGLCERLAHRLNELAGEPLVRAHHGSLAHARRKEIEEALARGELRAIVATSSLELGIDMATVDLVIGVESPGSVSRGLQRIGRAGHAVGETSRGILFPKHRADLLEATVVAAGMRAGEVEAIRVPRQPLDVLAQQIVASVAEEPVSVEALRACLSRAASYAGLSRSLLDPVLDMLSGRYPSTDFAELRPRLLWDREADRLEIREGAGRIALLSGGTIPDRGQYTVHLGAEGPRVGELDEEMVHETKPGDVVTLGASSWRVLEITRDRVIVAPAPGEPGRLPFWRGEGPGRPIELGRALGAFTRELLGRSDARTWLVETKGLDAHAAENLVDYVSLQQAWTGSCPTDRRITIERFRDELGDWRVCLLSPFGARVHAPWALAIEARLAERSLPGAQILWTDDGIMLRFADADRLPPSELFVLDPDEIEELVVTQLESSALYATEFRENAARALLLPRRRPGARTPLWTQRLRAQTLQAVAAAFPDFPIVLETYRSCLQDVFDLPALTELMEAIRERSVTIDDVETRSASPFARSLVFAYTAAYLYQGDMPAAERRSQALALDRHMLRELLGAEALRDLLDADVIDRVEARLQGLDPELRARHADALHDLLRRIGDLDSQELAQRFEGDPQSLRRMLGELGAAKRIARIEVASTTRFVVAEDVALYRDALGIAPPPGLPEALLEPAHAPLEQLIVRFARTHGPFETEAVARRFGLGSSEVEPMLASLHARGRLVSGELDPRGTQREWCESEVLRRIKRETLARLREEVSPVPRDTFTRFLIDWHGVESGRRGESRLDEVIDRLEGLPLSFAELERSILPARLSDYDPRWLDERAALGQLVWVGRRAIGERDGRVALYRRERAPLLLEAPPDPEDLAPLERRILEQLSSHGASFHPEIVARLEPEDGSGCLPAIWSLVWRGLVTNDGFTPLRALGRRPASRRPRRARVSPGSSSASGAAAGRWSLVSSLLARPPTPTERLHARARLYLERHGVLTREAMALETEPGGFGAIHPILREMEERGRVRRGHFVAGLAGMQIAAAGVVDRLREARSLPVAPRAVLLAATDPAQPHGVWLEWPAGRGGGPRPHRAVGAAVVLVDGRPMLHLDRGGRRVTTFLPEPQDEGAIDSSREEASLAAAIHSLASGLERLGRRRLCVEEIDGERARLSPLADLFTSAGFRAGYRGLELERSAPDSGAEMRRG